MKRPPPTIAHSFQPASLTARLDVCWFALVIQASGSSPSHTLIVIDLFPTEGAVQRNSTVAFAPAASVVIGFPFGSSHRTPVKLWFVSLPETTIENWSFRFVAVAFPFAFVKLTSNRTCEPSSGLD